mgnify:CR=1 FL=1
MALAVLQEDPIVSPEEFMVWSFTHAAHHKDINRVVFELGGSALPEYILDPFNPNDMNTWLYQHQLMHDAQNAVLGIAGFNLTRVDWEDQGDRDAWLWNHAQEHYQAGAILGLG